MTKHRTAATDSTLEGVSGANHWTALAREAYQRMAADLAALEPGDWDRPTPCAGWTVRELGGHLLGAMRAAASLRELASQQREIRGRVKETGENQTDAMTAVQIRRTSDLDVDRLVAEMQRLVEPATRGRRRLPQALQRIIRIPVEIGSISERWSLAYLNGCILTRDAWLHRVDLADALGKQPALDQHDRAVIGDAAVEWARRHGQPVELVLTGPAGGQLRAGSGGDSLTIDAVEFCRVVSGRHHHDHPLMAQEVPF